MEPKLIHFIRESLNGHEYAVAKVVYEMFKDRYLCQSIQDNQWTMKKNDQWVEMKEGVELFNLIPSFILQQYLLLNREYLTQAIKSGLEDKQKQFFIDSSRKLLDVVDKIQRLEFRKLVFEECKYLFYEFAETPQDITE
jgi:hypothetical protein